MSPLPDRRVGMAIVSIEQERAAGHHVLICVQTVGDVIDGAQGPRRAFADADGALEYLREWLSEWSEAP